MKLQMQAESPFDLSASGTFSLYGPNSPATRPSGPLGITTQSAE